ncbi:MAG: transposase family protein [Alphaproteobacteria bacterium]
MAADDLVAHFSGIYDPRCAGKIEHRLMDVLVIAVCETIAGAESWEDMALYGRSKAVWLGGFLAMLGGIPSRKKAAWDDQYMTQIISGKFHA